MPGRDLCLLSLDGGGVRGLSSLYILERIMGTINARNEREGKPRQKPCEYFDMIGGTSTGGYVQASRVRDIKRIDCADVASLIAIMLGCLEMDVRECIEAYVNLADQVFRKTVHRFTGNCCSKAALVTSVHAKFSAKRLEAAIKEILREKNYAENTLLLNARQRCKVYDKFHQLNPKSH